MRRHLLVTLIVVCAWTRSAEFCTRTFQCTDSNFICANGTMPSMLKRMHDCQTGRYTTNKCFQEDAPKHNVAATSNFFPVPGPIGYHRHSFVALFGIKVSAPAGIGVLRTLERVEFQKKILQVVVAFWSPLFILFGKFAPHGAIPLSKVLLISKIFLTYSEPFRKATIFGGALSNNIFNLRRRHPTAANRFPERFPSEVKKPTNEKANQSIQIRCRFWSRHRRSGRWRQCRSTRWRHRGPARRPHSSFTLSIRRHLRPSG